MVAVKYVIKVENYNTVPIKVNMEFSKSYIIIIMG